MNLRAYAEQRGRAAGAQQELPARYELGSAELRRERSGAFLKVTSTHGPRGAAECP